MLERSNSTGSVQTEGVSAEHEEKQKRNNSDVRCGDFNFAGFYFPRCLAGRTFAFYIDIQTLLQNFVYHVYSTNMDISKRGTYSLFLEIFRRLRMSDVLHTQRLEDTDEVWQLLLGSVEETIYEACSHFPRLSTSGVDVPEDRELVPPLPAPFVPSSSSSVALVSSPSSPTRPILGCSKTTGAAVSPSACADSVSRSELQRQTSDDVSWSTKSVKSLRCASFKSSSLCATSSSPSSYSSSSPSSSSSPCQSSSSFSCPSSSSSSSPSSRSASLPSSPARMPASPPCRRSLSPSPFAPSSSLSASSHSQMASTSFCICPCGACSSHLPCLLAVGSAYLLHVLYHVQPTELCPYYVPRPLTLSLDCFRRLIAISAYAVAEGICPELVFVLRHMVEARFLVISSIAGPQSLRQDATGHPLTPSVELKTPFHRFSNRGK